MEFIGHLIQWLILQEIRAEGRIVEGAGEDPYLGSQIAIQRVKGYQSDNFNSPF